MVCSEVISSESNGFYVFSVKKRCHTRISPVPWILSTKNTCHKHIVDSKQLCVGHVTLFELLNCHII